ncbi:unnamed protein product [Acanthoscelides obtectus]|uniref:Uncharacterized protein n=1 Tax=Acanthoscelides obtectus TaxID=200917 RepID=A0A9P0KBF5_ACAOB|nr:unnamed protein product [Acanthoscelides obtectus]CAK1625619.1 hypothetical protein AOBTE_LOCUS3278 [Acanthoscelides obtectus]
MEDLLKVSFIYISELGRLLLFPDRVMRVEDRAANICTIFVSKKLADFLSESQNSRQPPPHGTLLFDPRSGKEKHDCMCIEVFTKYSSYR